VLCAAAHNTYVASWTGMVYVAFVIDVFSRRVVGWRAATDMTTPLVLDALEMALWTRRKDGITDLAGLVHHNDAGSQYTSIAFTQRLIDEGVDASVGSVGDAYDNALAESHMGLYKSELIHSYGPWKGLEHVEAATLDWVHWFNTGTPPSNARIAKVCRRSCKVQLAPSSRFTLPITARKAS